MSYHPYQPQIVALRQIPVQSSTVHLVLAWITAGLTLGYMLPWAIAASRNKTGVVAIVTINVFLGWTAVGWIIALVMACSDENNQASPVSVNAQTNYRRPVSAPPGYGYQGPGQRPNWPPAYRRLELKPPDYLDVRFTQPHYSQITQPHFQTYDEPRL